MRKYKIKPGPKVGSLRPNKWSSGPDPVLHAKYKVWGQQRNQAQWRGEGWDLPFLEWVDIWGDLYEFKGQSSDCFCMTRINASQPWTKDNVKIIKRKEHFLSNRNQEGRYSKRKD